MTEPKPKPKFYKTPSINWGYTYLEPACHFIWAHFFEGQNTDTPCGYCIEPSEVAGQTFTSTGSDVTCKECQDYVARSTELTILGQKRRG